MPKGRPPDGEHALSNAERQARYRARHQPSVGFPPASAGRTLANSAQKPAPAIRYRRPADRRTRPQRWLDAVAELVALQAEYTAWADALPETLRDTATAEALQAIVELDLDTLAAVEPPRGYGRD